MSPWCLPGRSNSVLVEFQRDGQYVMPDPGSIRLTIFDNSGVAVTGYDGVPQPDVTATTVLLNIPASVNFINEERENRFLRVEFTNDGYPCVFKTTYRLTNFLPIEASAADVRSALGLRDSELDDEEVDLYSAYFELSRKIPTLGARLISGDDSAMYANRALVLMEALRIFPSLPLRAVKEDSLNNASLIRATIDWENLRASLEAQLQEALSSIDTMLPVTYLMTPLLVLTTPIDPVTNV